MRRFVVEICYDGTAYAGWQKQPNALTVQEVLDDALSTILKQTVQTVGGGRTDAGVHADQLHVHFDIATELPPNILHSLNGILPADIGVNNVFVTGSPDFHARFDALSRAYEYHIVLQKTPLMRHRALWVRQYLDIEKMQEAAKSLLAYSDFASFCKAHGNQKTTLCDLMRSEWKISPGHLIFCIKANRFLRGMVRAIVGTILEVGTGKRDLDSLKQAVLARDRVEAGPNVAPHGLVLTKVTYPDNFLKIHKARR
jgi:tRNA pseudouridine38-40 synthase